MTLASVLTFVLWPFNGEAVLWRMASEYPLAALISILGVYLATQEEKSESKYKILAAILICIAVLANQLAALAGFVVWLLVVGCSEVQADFSFRKYRWRQFIFIISGYIVGGLTSLIIIYQFAPTGDRSALASNFLEKLTFLVELNKLFIVWPEFYPGWLKGLHILLFAGSAGWFALRSYRRRAAWKALAIPLLVLASLFVVPYIPLLLVGESWPAFRSMYLAPFLFVMALNLFTLGDTDHPAAGWAPSLLLGTLLVGYFWIARVNSADYVKVFEGDLQILHQIELTAAEWKADQVTVASYPDYSYDWNPYQITYLHGDSKISAFQFSYSWEPFIHLFSGLSTVKEDSISQACIAACYANEREHPFEYTHLNQGNTLCVCP
jgi:hypothetical protein